MGTVTKNAAAGAAKAPVESAAEVASAGQRQMLDSAAAMLEVLLKQRGPEVAGQEVQHLLERLRQVPVAQKTRELAPQAKLIAWLAGITPHLRLGQV